MNLEELNGQPDQFLLAFEPGEAVFAPMNRAAYQNSIFCDGRIKPAGDITKTPLAPLLTALKQNAPSQAPISYIFHVAHCGSTLLARALDRADATLSIREPLSLRQLGAEKATFAGGHAPEEWVLRLELATRLLGRRYNKNQKVIVKGNVPTNFIVPELLARSANAPSIFLYFPLEHYLYAILRTPNHHKWVGNIINENRKSIEQLAPLKPQMSVAQAAASLWLAQVKIYAEALETNTAARSLNAEDLFNKPAAVLRAAFDHFGVSFEDKEIDDIVGSDLFQRYSKNPDAPFDNTARLQRRAQLKVQLAPAIREARDWVEYAVKSGALPKHLRRPLIGQSPALLDPV